MQNNTFTTKVALVTGAARRIGAEIARTLHQAGMNVALHYYASEDEATALCQELNQLRPHSAQAFSADLNETESIKSLVQQAVAAWGRLDVLVNNASRFYRTHIGDVTDYAWDDLMSSNLKAPFFLAQAAAPSLTTAKGCIVNITDIYAESPLKDYAVYCMSKSGLLMMTKALAKELGPHVRVNAVAPGPIIWPEGSNAYSELEKKKIIDETVLRRAGHPEDVAKAVLFFVRDADYVSGQVLNIDGGRTV